MDPVHLPIYGMDIGNDSDDDLSSMSSSSSSSSSGSDSSEADEEMQLSDDSASLSLPRVNRLRIPIVNSILVLSSLSIQVDMLLEELSNMRFKRRPYIRRDLDNYWQITREDPSFDREIRMKRRSFIKLLSFVGPSLLVNEEMGARRGGAISPAMCLYMTIRYLVGDSYQIIASACGVSPSAFYTCLFKTLKVICACPELAIVFPSTDYECDQLAGDFENHSEKGAIVNCVGCVDGYLLAITVPPKVEDDNARSYYSGHYKKPGINVQACCDVNCIFTYFGISAPGSANDRAAIKENIGGESLFDKIQRLPGEYVILADAAYEPTEKLIPMFYGHQRDSPLNSNFNFAASSLRMRIEMAFGQMTAKFAILQRPLKNSLPYVSYIGLGCAQLHNFCVKERVYGDSIWDQENRQPFQYRRATPNLRNMDERFPATHENENRYMYVNSGISTRRNKMAYLVKDRGVTRPRRSVLHPDHVPNLRP